MGPSISCQEYSGRPSLLWKRWRRKEEEGFTSFPRTPGWFKTFYLLWRKSDLDERYERRRYEINCVSGSSERGDVNDLDFAFHWILPDVSTVSGIWKGYLQLSWTRRDISMFYHAFLPLLMHTDFCSLVHPSYITKTPHYWLDHPEGLEVSQHVMCHNDETWLTFCGRCNW